MGNVLSTASRLPLPILRQLYKQILGIGLSQARICRSYAIDFIRERHEAYEWSGTS